tara:strand:+ start:1392 stop:2096 length:705 start_codon:yes stop_codon:yes gene_type:complete
LHVSIETLIDRFPDLRIAVVVAGDLSILETASPALADEIAAIEAKATARFADVGMGDIPGVADWRRAYRAFGIKKTSYRCSVERLIRKTLRDGALARINPFVDAYNAVSLKHVFPLGADDLDNIAGDICFRQSQEGDTFYALGQAPAENDPPKPGEVVYADDEKVLCRRWNWYQDARSPVTTSTTRAVVTIQSLGSGDLAAAVDDLERLIRDHFAAQTGTTILSIDEPMATLPI